LTLKRSPNEKVENVQLSGTFLKAGIEIKIISFLKSYRDLNHTVFVSLEVQKGIYLSTLWSEDGDI
jgi:hypothetical protein